MRSATSCPALWVFILGTAFPILGCDTPTTSPSVGKPDFAEAPADGQGNKFVIPINEPFTLDCGAEQLTGTATGWIAGRVFPQPKNRNAELDVFHVVLTYRNSAGKTFTFVEVGPDRVWFNFDTGEFFVDVVGRSAGSGLLGRLVVNLNTGEVVFFAGNPVGPSDDLACQALT